MLFFILLILSSCGTKTYISQVQGKDTEIPELNAVIVKYFANFNDINKWSDFTTDDFIKRVYLWCSGDSSESKSTQEMKKIYYELNKDK